MNTAQPANQEQIEARAAALAGVAPGPDQTMRDVYGEMGDWVFHLGVWEFLLDPVARRWYYLDFAHNQYNDTGYGAGEVTFALSEEGGFTPPPRRAASTVAAAPASPAVPVPRFCARCGAALESGWKFCAKCRAPVAGTG